MIAKNAVKNDALGWSLINMEAENEDAHALKDVEASIECPVCKAEIYRSDGWCARCAQKDVDKVLENQKNS